jgi:uncharacterized protein involved in exopolysaccharide biosynthesis/Mrp family chromosome partitioning ATPase
MTAAEIHRDGEGAFIPAQPRREPDQIDFAWLFQTFRRRVWTFVITVAVTLGAVVLFMFLYAPVYQATARITINQRQVFAQPEKETAVVGALPVVSSDVDTETQVVQSRRVAQIVVERLNLANDPEFRSDHPTFKQRLSDFFNALFHPAKSISAEDRAIDSVLGRLSPERFLATNAIDINFRDNNPAKAQTLANAFAQAYLENQVASKVAQNTAVINAMASQLEAMRQQADSDSQKVQAFKIAHNLFSVGPQSLTEQEISGFDQDVATAKAEAAADEANLKTAQQQLVQGSSGEDVGAALNSSVVTELRAQKAQLSDKLANLESHYGPKYPNLAQARRQVANIDLEIQAEILRDIANLSAKAKASGQRLASLEATRNATKGSLSTESAAQAGLENLVRAQTVSQAIYQAYLQRFKESVAQARSLTPDAEIVSVAGLPSATWFPDPLLFPALGIVAALLFGIASVLLAEMLDRRIRTARDVERLLGRPYLGGIPLNDRATPLDAVVHSPRGEYSEAFRGLLASIRLANPNPRSCVIEITSARSGDGKTIIAAGLARAAALLGASAVIVDFGSGDPARAVTRVLRVTDPGPGLAGLLRGETQLEAALRADAPSGAAVLPIGDARTPPEGLMAGAPMDGLLAQLRERFEFIFLDAPALSIATSRALAAKADVVVIVAPWGSKPEDGLEDGLNLPPLDRMANVGVALNRVVEPRPVRRIVTDLFGADREPPPRPSRAPSR